MKVFYFVTILAFFYYVMTPSNLLVRRGCGNESKEGIFETGICLDVDDVGALAVLHALADSGEAEFLAISFNEVHPSGANAIREWHLKVSVSCDNISVFYLRQPTPSNLLAEGLLTREMNPKKVIFETDMSTDSR